MTRPVKILFLASNPVDTEQLHLDFEIKAIKQRINAATLADRFHIEQEWAVSPQDIPGHLMRYRPHLVHFSGHGNAAGELMMHDPKSKMAKPVSPDSLTSLFTALTDDISCVVLNACYSTRQAEGIAKAIPCVVGMTRAVSDQGAIAFASGFYEALAFGKSIATAFQLGGAQISLAGYAAELLTPCLSTKAGIDATKLHLTEPAMISNPEINAVSNEVSSLDISLLGDILAILLPSEFEKIILRLRINPSLLPSQYAPQLTRALALCDFIITENRLHELVRALNQLRPGLIERKIRERKN